MMAVRSCCRLYSHESAPTTDSTRKAAETVCRVPEHGPTISAACLHLVLREVERACVPVFVRVFRNPETVQDHPANRKSAVVGVLGAANP